MQKNIPVELFPCLETEKSSTKPVLSGEINGVETIYHSITANSGKQIDCGNNSATIMIILGGKGTINSSIKSISFDEMAVYVPDPSEQYITIKSKSTVEIVEIMWQLTNEEFADLRKRSLPYFLKYSEARTYKEAIKSPKTINRTLVHEDLIPRFCMGSVETEGPDSVGAHTHPILEQHFLGLVGNNCYVKADDSEVLFPERALLHIPLGSEHSVRVETGKKLHYIWIDYFMDAEGVSWIKKMHKSDE